MEYKPKKEKIHTGNKGREKFVEIIIHKKLIRN